MSDETKESKATTIAKSVERIADSKGLESVGHALGIGLFFFGLATIGLAVGVATKWDGHLHPEPKCYEFKEVSGELYRLNLCTGETEKADVADNSNPAE